MIDYIQGILEMRSLLNKIGDAMLKNDSAAARIHLNSLRYVASLTDEQIVKQFPAASGVEAKIISIR
jgi:hypothetical protein